MQRHLNWEGCDNARDIGGYATKDGRETRWGVVMRSAHMSQMTEAGQAALVAQGVRTIIDLRMPYELSIDPSPFAEDELHGVGYTNISFHDPSTIPSTEAASLAEAYKRDLELYLPNVGAIMTAIARAPEGGVLFHCAAGKDRTGIISAMLLELAGVPRETIGADYALTEECLRDRTARWLEHGPGERSERERQIAWSRPLAEVMLEVLNYLDARYGGVEAYLHEAGVAPEDIEHLRERLVGPR